MTPTSKSLYLIRHFHYNKNCRAGVSRRHGGHSPTLNLSELKMAKKNRNKNTFVSARDYHKPIATSVRRVHNYVYPSVQRRYRSPLASYSAPIDNRLYHPRRAFRPILTVSYRNAPIRQRFKKGNSLVFQKIFSAPNITSPCIRRTTRRQVLFATKGAGKGMRHGKKHVRRNASSSISC